MSKLNQEIVKLVDEAGLQNEFQDNKLATLAKLAEMHPNKADKINAFANSAAGGIGDINTEIKADLDFSNNLSQDINVSGDENVVQHKGNISFNNS